MMFSITFHHLIVGLVTGMGTLCSLSGMLAYLSKFFVGGSRYRDYLDKVAYVSAIAVIPCLLLAVLSGTSASPNPGGDAMTYNKFLFSGLTLGFVVSMIIGRWRFGSSVWTDSKLGALQATCAAGMLAGITVLGSIGGKMTLGESTMDILPFWPEFDKSIVVGQWFGLALLILGIASMVISLKMGPKAERLAE